MREPDVRGWVLRAEEEGEGLVAAGGLASVAEEAGAVGCAVALFAFVFVFDGAAGEAECCLRGGAGGAGGVDAGVLFEERDSGGGGAWSGYTGGAA